MSELASSQAFYELAKTGKYSKTWLTNKINQMQDHELRMGVVRYMTENKEAFYQLGVALGSATAVLGAIATGTFTLPGTPEVKHGTGKVGNYTPGYQPSTPEEWRDIMAEEGFTPQSWPISKKNKKPIYVPEGYVLFESGKVMTRDEAEAYMHQQLPNIPAWLMGPGGMAIGYGIEKSGLVSPEDVDLLPGGFEKSLGDFTKLFDNMFSMVGMGFAGWCAAVLLLKAIFGEDGLSQLPFSGGVL